MSLGEGARLDDFVRGPLNEVRRAQFADLAPSANRLDFACTLKDKPAFGVEGWKLEGDVHASNGDVVAAKNVYVKSAELQKAEVHKFDMTPKSELEPQPFSKEVAKAVATPELTTSATFNLKNHAVGATRSP